MLVGVALFLMDFVVDFFFFFFLCEWWIVDDGGYGGGFVFSFLFCNGLWLSR